jgi:hypothetical protein
MSTSRCIVETRERTEKFIAEFLQKAQPRSIEDLRHAFRRCAVTNHTFGYAAGFAEGMVRALEIMKEERSRGDD